MADDRHGIFHIVGIKRGSKNIYTMITFDPDDEYWILDWMFKRYKKNIQSDHIEKFHMAQQDVIRIILDNLNDFEDVIFLDH